MSIQWSACMWPTTRPSSRAAPMDASRRDAMPLPMSKRTAVRSDSTSRPEEGASGGGRAGTAHLAAEERQTPLRMGTAGIDDRDRDRQVGAALAGPDGEADLGRSDI